MFGTRHGRHVMWLGLAVLTASALLSAHAAETGARVVEPSEMKWTAIALVRPISSRPKARRWCRCMESDPSV
jgi:hypothetical protein